LLLTTRELMGVPIAEAGEAHRIQGSRDAVHDFGPGYTRHLEPEGYILGDGHVREQAVILEHHAEAAPVRRKPRDVPPTDANAAAIRSLKARNDAQRRRLAAAGRPEKCD
jgi:hypothetical protein